MSRESWANALASYAALEGDQWAFLKPFRILLERIARAEEVQGLTAVTSMSDLLVSPYSRYPDWFEGRRVYLRPHHSGKVKVEVFSDGNRSKPTEEWTATAESAAGRILEALSRL